LQVGVARHDRVGVFRRGVQGALAHVVKRVEQVHEDVATAQAVQGRQQIVAAASDVQTPADVGADLLDQVCLVVEIGVFAQRIERHGLRADLLHFEHAASQGDGHWRVYQAAFGKHDDMGLVDVTEIAEAVGEPCEARCVDEVADFRCGGFLESTADFGFEHGNRPSGHQG